ncbi:MAG: RDD family protein [Verrucomicrobia bacterium]|nr:RDD family protein [Verrucomicrobiota bacterium]
MSWYYGVDGRSQGPVEETTLQTLELSGAIEWNTPVWCAGMAGWKPYGEIFRRPSVQCHECERSVDQEPAIRYRGLSICPRCAPLFFQKVREGLASEEAAQYCGFWIRFSARMLDGLILAALTIPLSILNQVIIFRTYPLTGPGAGMERFENTARLGEFLTIQAAFVLISLVLGFAYEVYFVARFGGTPGKLLLRMRIVRSDFSRLTYGRSAIRFFGKMLSDLTMYIGYIMVGFDPQRRALHDYIADTRVIKRDSRRETRA